MINFFKNKRKESDAERIYKIYENKNISERIRFIVNSEYKRMIYLAEKAALEGKTSLTFDLDIGELDIIHFNRIMHQFITRLIDNGFRYSRQMLNKRNQLKIYFSQINIKK